MSRLVKSERDFKTTTDIDNHSHAHQHEQDLLLAAEIGKSLLERNNELEAALKVTQEYAEEQCAQAEFYMKQVDILRDGKEETSLTCEHLESTNQSLSDKCDQWKAEFKILEGKNTRLWEVINSLEKRIEELTSKLEIVSEDLAQVKRKEHIMEETDIQLYEFNNISNSKVNMDGDNYDTSTDYTFDEDINELLKKQLSELNIQLKLEKLQKDEIGSQLEDIISENQLLYHKISSLNQEVKEWENFAQKEENYRRLAAAFTLKHGIETESNIEGIIGRSVENISQESLFHKKTIAKSKSCDYLDRSEKPKNVDFFRSPYLNATTILPSVNDSSFLSELDTQYSELVNRYEMLHEKYKQEGKWNENLNRTRKVQKAIQTLSLDFSLHKIPVTSSKRDKESTSTSEYKDGNEKQIDYRTMFSDIFAKLKESNVPCT